MLHDPWYVIVDDINGGWAVATSYAPLSQQRPDQRVATTIADEDVAQHIVGLHNSTWS